MFYIAGLGNPGEKYDGTRHNTGRDMVCEFQKKQKFPDWQKDKKTNSMISSGTVGKQKVMLVLPETFMNKSGLAMKALIPSAKAVSNLIVLYDDLDLPFGKLKISFNRGAGGHRGILSIEKNLKTKKFLRIRVGISPVTKTGKPKKPSGEEAVIDFILGKFKKTERDEFQKISKRVNETIEDIIILGLEKAMGKWN